jgi:hypothetical protein
MIIEIEFLESAFKHGLSDKEIMTALLDEDSFVDYRTGFDIGQVSSGDWIEIGGRYTNNGKTYLIYHAQRVKF